jgi:hypothetical protein
MVVTLSPFSNDVRRVRMKRAIVTALALVCLTLIVFATGCWEVFCPINEEPVAVIERPRLQGPGVQIYANIVTFGWTCETECKPLSIRYLCMLVTDTNGVYDPTFNIIQDLNDNLWRYEDKWSDWVRYSAPGDSGRMTIIGDDEVLEINKQHIFAVQARSYCRNVTRTFELNTNVRLFIPTNVSGPLLTIREPFLGFSKFIGTDMPPVKYDIPPAVTLGFSWEADASAYGGEIVCYRYGWDVQDIHDPSDWDTDCIPSLQEATERKLYSGVHVLYVEANDNAGRTTRGAIQINIIPLTMERNLLWVDDFPSIDPQPPLYEMPGESSHDAFWIDICSRAEGFDPGLDVYDCFYDHGLQPPPIQEICKYKNIIWTYSASNDAWRKVVEFTPEGLVGPAPVQTLNYLPLFLARGGHLWSLGRSERGGGLAAVFKPSMLPLMPAFFKTEMSPNPDDESGVFCMAYKDYCVTAIDKISGNFKTNPAEVPPNFDRRLDKDAMRFAYKDGADVVTAEYPGLPAQLDLWEEVTKPGRFFDPQVRGFFYCEIYDPQYYMDFHFETSQACFHPIYRMRSRNSLSVINDQTVAIWITKYEDVIPAVESGVAVAARSVHFGFPLWFFDRAAVDEIVEIVFDEWQIMATP